MMTLLRNVALGALGLTAALVVVWAGQALVLAVGGPVILAVVGWYLLKAVRAVWMRHAPKKHEETNPLRKIDTSTKAGRKLFIETAARMARESREELRDGIE